MSLHLGDCLHVMRTMPAASFDSVVTDPPAGISFMGKPWDSDRGGRDRFVAWLAERMTEAFRLAVPGAYALVWALPRTSHWTGWALEDAGWTVHDRVSHVFGSGMPKAWNRLKPAMEDWWLVHKSVGRMVPLNIDACRVPANGESLGGGDQLPKVKTKSEGWDRPWMRDAAARAAHALKSDANVAKAELLGRWPAHLIHDGSDEVLAGFPFTLPSKSGGVSTKMLGRHNDDDWEAKPVIRTGHNDSGGSAARYFYCAKASAADREDFNDHPTCKSTRLMRWLCRLITPPAGRVLDPFMGSGSTGKACALEGFAFTGITDLPEHLAIAERRIANSARDAECGMPEPRKARPAKVCIPSHGVPSLFDHLPDHD